ncbi:MAG TPA: hypothetical protein VLB76_26420 [Thermoanaerobaculia bacterium]|nr:hypothetical protein [Thermoanaerobaculia bacterium]
MANSRFSDPFVDEVHEIREKLLQECDGDLEKLMDCLQLREKEDRPRVVRDLKEVKAPSDRRS